MRPRESPPKLGGYKSFTHLNNFEHVGMCGGSDGDSPTHDLSAHHLGVLVGGGVDVGHLHAVLGECARLV